MNNLESWNCRRCGNLRCTCPAQRPAMYRLLWRFLPLRLRLWCHERLMGGSYLSHWPNAGLIEYPRATSITRGSSPLWDFMPSQRRER